jgi:hypothetical protein
MSGQPGPHDALFRRVLGEPVNAASQLRAALPAALAGRLDLDRLERVSGSFVDATLAWRHSDLLFTVPMADREALVYVLVEHQSSADPLMPFRMLRYVVRIWDHYLARHPGAAQLPVVIPLVVHHNKRPWTSPVQLGDLLDLDQATAGAAAEHLPRFAFLLDDLARLDEQALRARPLTPPARITLLLLKIAAGNSRLAADLRGWSDDLRAILDRPGGEEEFAAVLRYIELVGEAPADQLRTLVAALGPDAEEAYVTTAEMLRAEGEARGRSEALAQLLTLKFGQLPQPALDTLHAASASQLETWTARVLTADTLAEVLR